MSYTLERRRLRNELESRDRSKQGAQGRQTGAADRSALANSQIIRSSTFCLIDGQTSTASTGRRSERGSTGPRPNRTTRSGRWPVNPSAAAKGERNAATSTGWFKNALRMPSAVACSAKRS